MVQLSVEIFLWPDMMVKSAFRWLISEYIKTDSLAVLCLVVGTIRTVALAANGRSFVIGPCARSICALISALLWMQFSYALYQLGQHQGYPSPGLPFWSTFTVAEFYVAYRAMIDVKRNL